MIRPSRFSSYALKVFGMLVVIMSSITAVQATSLNAVRPHSLRQASQLPTGTVPSVVPKDYVVTPMGYFPAECVHEIKPTDKMLTALRVQHADGSMSTETACTRPHFTRHGQRIDSVQQMQTNTRADMIASQLSVSELATAVKAGTVKPNSSGGYYAEISYINGNTGTRELDATFKVPKKPMAVDGQVVFLFPGLVQTNPIETILQPVLSWDNFGEARWQYVSWNCCGADGSGTANYSTPIDVNVGDKLYGQMSMNCPVGSGTCSSYSIVSMDETTNEYSTLDTGDSGVTGSSGEVDNWIVGAALEAYGVTNCQEFPATGSIKFSKIRALDPHGKLIHSIWANDNALLIDTPDCNYTTNWDNTTNWIYY